MDELAELLGESPAIERIRDTLRRLLDRQRAGQRLPAILLQGGTGTGKGLVARLLHRHGARRQGPFVDVNCAAIPDTLLEAELFGFERGAFTDARRAKPGLFQTAHGGVLFLDEVALLPDPLQAKLLTAVEERAVRRLGSTLSEPADAWLISASNTDLKTAVAARRFREDLYHRLAVLTLHLPPLRERGRDILLLAERFLARACAEYGLPPRRLDPGTQARLLGYSWPGNIRELGNVMERAALLTDAPAITADGLGLPDDRDLETTAPEPASGRPTSRDEAMRQRLLTALDQMGWNISHTAAFLGLARSTVYAHLDKYGLRAEALRSPAAKTTMATKPAAPAALDTGLHWERRSLTLLRAELSNTDSIDTWSQTSRALDAIIAKVHSFGGHIEDLTPTGLVAAFGLEPAEDAPRRAAHTALAVQKETTRAHGRNGGTPEVTIGVHVAPLLIGRVGPGIEIDATAKRAQWSVLDQLLLGKAPGEMVVSGAAAPFLERRFELTRMDEVDGQEPVYRLTGQERRGLGLWGAMTRFVGRQEELQILRSRLATAKTGHGQVVAVGGEAGVGKSRLIYEVARGHLIDGWRVLEGTALPYGQAMSYLPVIDLLKGYFSLQDRDDPRGIGEKVTGKLLSLDRALEPTLPALLALLDVPVDDTAWRALDPPQRRRRTLDAVRQLLTREAREQPLLLIFEDLHWIDGETQALLDSVVDTVGSERLLLLVSYRPEYRHAWTSKPCYSQFRLDALPVERASEFLDALLGEDPALTALKQLLVERGNPFFLEETVRTLVETRALEGPRGGYRLTHPVSALEVPPTVEAVLAARIDRLAPEDKRLLQVASVVGKDVPSALLQGIADLPEEALRRGLGSLQSAEFLYETGPFPEVEYSFKHAVTHEVAYGSVLHERRRDLHARLVEAIETAHPDRLGEQVERLAQHALRGEVWAKAVAYHRQAAAKAVSRSANREAVNCLEQALGALSHLPESPETQELAIDLRLDLQVPLNNLGEIERLLDSLREAEPLAGALGDLHRTGLVAVYMTFALWATGQLEQAVASGERALAIARTLGNVGLEAQANSRLGQAYGARGDYLRAIAAFKRNVDALVGDLQTERFGMPSPPAIMSRTWMGWGLASLGEFPAALAVGEEAVRMAETADDRLGLTLSQLRVGLIHLRQGDAERALPWLESALGSSRRFNLEILGVYAASGLGEARAACGDTSAALALLEHASERAASIGFAHAALGALGEGYLLAGRLAEARLTAGRMLELTRAAGSRHSEAEALRILGEVHARMNPVEAGQAEELYREALAIAEQLGTRPLAARCHLDLGKLYRCMGKREQANEHLTTASSMYREMDMPLWLEQAETEIIAAV